MAHQTKHSVDQRLQRYLSFMSLLMVQIGLVLVFTWPVLNELVLSLVAPLTPLSLSAGVTLSLNTFLLTASVLILCVFLFSALKIRQCYRNDLIDPILISSKALNIYAQLVNLNRGSKRQSQVNELFNKIEAHNRSIKSKELSELSDITTSLLEAQEKADLDIRQKAQALEKAQDAQNQFLANMSHEIRTPLNGVIGLSASLLQESISDQQCEKVETIKQSSEHLLKILNTLFDVAQGNDKQLELEEYEFDLHRTIHDIVHLLMGEATKKNIHLGSKISDLVPRHVKGDGHRLSQVLIQLLDNGIKFTKLGSVNVLVSLEKGLASLSNNQASKQETLEIKFKVVDTGVGIAEDKRKKLFKAFTQDDLSNTRKYGGVGLGLTVSRQVVELMGGKIKVSSTYGQGSEFSFSVPFAVVENSPAINAEEVGIDEGLAFKMPLSILVAEDDEVNQTVAELLFEEMGYEVDIAENGERACYAAKEKSYDIVFMDLHMPKMDGLEATKHILEFAREGTIEKPPCIIALTASIIEQTRKECFEVGMKDFINKPIDAYVLQEMLIKWGGCSSAKSLKSQSAGAQKQPSSSSSGQPPLLH